MRRTTVRVPWAHGLHFRPAARLVRLARRFRSTITLRLGQATADLTSILSIVGLCAMMGAPLDVEARGEDEDLAIREITQAFAEPDAGEDGTATPGVDVSPPTHPS
ncbi:MAG: HPr family phosphocarrier protein [Opitutaceae bacterium]|nr:HPr family phosphocarrier protein [Opitutaceae bacterium]